MQLKRLEVAYTRVFEQAEFEFQPGMNLLVGINGAGKSTVLDVLRIMLSYSLPRFTASKSRPIPFEESDITVGEGALTAELSFEAAGISFEHLMHIPRKNYMIDESSEGQVRQQTYGLVERNDFRRRDGKDISKGLKNSKAQPLVVYFSTIRSTPTRRKPSTLSSTGGQAAAFADALSHSRTLHLREFAEWWLVQEALADEIKSSARRLNVFNDTVIGFLDGCTNLRAVREPGPTLHVDKGDIVLDVSQLSDGERSMIALVFDLARRLVQANPKLEDPLKDGKAVVLIDELDLHLHPKWQRTICDRLTSTFPNCQFIATTHSPQILGEVSPDSITLIEQGTTTRPHQSLGMDSSWILEYLMGTADRNPDIDRKLDEIGDLIEDEKFEQAAEEINKLRNEIGDFPQLVMLQARLDRFQLLGL